ncbi:MAG TPA: SDR family oxidoreductase [Bradyrhizobium sp.]|nr:SDR family oxidoreductase [Bradyrhizobium sp.]
MNIEGCVALVTGANRGLGKAYVEALLDAGCAKVYAGMRTGGTEPGERLVPIPLDVTSSQSVAAAAARCRDVNLVINNAGVMSRTPVLSKDVEVALQREMDVNVLGLIRMANAFAPVLASQGGGALVNMLSIVSWFTSAFNATYCASKHAAFAVTESMRMELRAQGTLVVSVHAGFIDTDMVAHIALPKVSPRQVAEQTLQGLRDRVEVVLADDRSQQVWNTTFNDPASIARTQQQIWDQG